MPESTSVLPSVMGSNDSEPQTLTKRPQKSLFEEGYQGIAQTPDESESMERMRHREEAITKIVDWIWIKANALLWVVATCAMIYFTNFFRVIWESPLIERRFLYAGFAALSFNLSLLAYLSFYLQCWCNVPEDRVFEQVPNAPMVSMIAAILTALFFLVALYPAYGLGWTLGIQFTFFMGFLNAGNFLPGGALGSIMLYGIFFGAFFTSIWIPHEGLVHNRPI